LTPAIDSGRPKAVADAAEVDGLVVLGASKGGFRALKHLLAALPGDFPWPLAIVQHRADQRESGLCELLDRAGALRVVEPEDKDPIRAGYAHLAPAGYHLLVEPGTFALSADPPIWFARPSIDVLFESAADVYGARVTGVILTGTGPDGAAGLAAIRARGGLALVEDPASAECRAMPEAALAATAVDRVLPLAALAVFLAGLPRRGGRS
jgi:two-component system chemotaxis response regulator CheB